MEKERFSVTLNKKHSYNFKTKYKGKKEKGKKIDYDQVFVGVNCCIQRGENDG